MPSRISTRQISGLVAIITAAAMMSGCALITAATDATVDGFHATTNATSSSSHSFNTEARSQAVQFVRSDIDAIRTDAARGHGEEIDALTDLLHEPNADEFGRWMQVHYAQLFDGLDQPEQLLTRIDKYRHSGDPATSVDGA